MRLPFCFGREVTRGGGAAQVALLAGALELEVQIGGGFSLAERTREATEFAL